MLAPHFNYLPQYLQDSTYNEGLHHINRLRPVVAYHLLSLQPASPATVLPTVQM
jgi:hypothetical protein